MPWKRKESGAREGECAARDVGSTDSAKRACKRDKGIGELRKHNIFVDFLPGELDSETDCEASMWGCSALRTPLSRCTHFKVVPAPCTEDEVLSARLRASVAVVTSIRASIRALAGESPEVLSAPNPSGRQDNGTGTSVSD